MYESNSNQSQSFSYKPDAPEWTQRTPSPATLPPLYSKTAFTSLRSKCNQNRMQGLPSNCKEWTEVLLTKKSTVQLSHLELPGIHLLYSLSQLSWTVTSIEIFSFTWPLCRKNCTVQLHASKETACLGPDILLSPFLPKLLICINTYNFVEYLGMSC